MRVFHFPSHTINADSNVFGNAERGNTYGSMKIKKYKVLKQQIFASLTIITFVKHTRNVCFSAWYHETDFPLLIFYLTSGK